MDNWITIPFKHVHTINHTKSRQSPRILGKRVTMAKRPRSFPRWRGVVGNADTFVWPSGHEPYHPTMLFYMESLMLIYGSNYILHQNTKGMTSYHFTYSCFALTVTWKHSLHPETPVEATTRRIDARKWWEGFHSISAIQVWPDGYFSSPRFQDLVFEPMFKIVNL